MEGGSSLTLSAVGRPSTFQPMQSRPTRFPALILFGLFLAGAFGLPLTDAALFHRAGHDPYAGTVHVEDRGGVHHADHCALGQSVLPQREALGCAGIARVAPPVASPVVLPAPLAPDASEPVTLQHSRAPPA